MDANQFDALVRCIPEVASRRGTVRFALASLATAVGAALVPWPMVEMGAKKKKKKKSTLCLDGQTIKASKKKKKKLLKSGATPGECPASPPPPVCTPQCSGTTCGSDGCGGTCSCGANTICHQEICHPCTVACTGNPGVCGALLQDALTKAGTVYLCPGRYVGKFNLGVSVTVIGAGDGEDPASNTILDANKTGRVVNVGAGIFADLHRLRITSGDTTLEISGNGGGILSKGDLTLVGCTVHKNHAGVFGGGISHEPDATGPLRLQDCTVSENTGGGGIYTENATQPLAIANCQITRNETSTRGGGLHVAFTTATVNSTAISDNHANARGGGVYIGAGTITFDSTSSVTGNTAAIEQGGIRNNGTVTLNGAVVRDNLPTNCVFTDLPSNPVEGCDD